MARRLRARASASVLPPEPCSSTKVRTSLNLEVKNDKNLQTRPCARAGGLATQARGVRP